MSRPKRPLKVASELESIDSYIDKNDKDGVKWLIDLHNIHCYDSYKRTFLIISATKGDISMLNYLIELGADLNFQDNNGYTALHFMHRIITLKF